MSRKNAISQLSAIITIIVFLLIINTQIVVTGL